MKKVYVSLFAVCVMILGSCASKRDAYQAAYERAKEKQVSESAPVADIVELEEEPKVDEPVMTTPTAKPEPAIIRTEKITAVDENESVNLHKYSVVVGSFMSSTNARGLRDRMKDKGYKAFLAQNENSMYRVIVESYPSRDQASQARDRVKTKFAPDFWDAWVLENLD